MSNKINFDIDCLRDKVSYSKKSKNDFEWAKQRCEYYDTHYYDITLKKFKRMKALYRIYKGMPTPEDYKFLTNPVDKNLSSTVPFVSYPIVDKVIKAIHGEEIRRPLKPIVFALNQDSLSKRSREKLELTKQYVYNSVFGAIDQEIQAAMEQAKSEEEAAQIQKQGEEKKAAMAPPEIDLFMSKEFRLPEEMQGQHILNAKLKTEKPKHSFDTALLHGLISGMGLVRITNARKPKIEALEPLFFDYEMSKGPDKIFIHKGNRWSYSQYMTLAEIYDEYGDDMSKKDKEKLDELRDKYRHEEMYPNPSMYNWEILEDLDDPMVWLDDRYIRVAHHVFRTLKEIGHLTRINLETGEIEELIVEEEYKINPLTDISLEFEWIPELWEITKIDIHDTIYTRIGPIEGQYRDIEDPHIVTPPYMGVVYDIINPDSPASIIQNGSYWQELYDIVMHYFKTTLATDWGNIITLSVNAKPDIMTTGEWLHTAVTKKFLLLDLAKEGTNPTDAQAIKGVNLSNTVDLQKYMQILAYIQKQCFESMYYNESRLGITTPYQTATANQQDIVQSSTQTMPYFNLHRMFVSDALEHYIELWRRYYVEHPEELSYITDDMSVASLLIDSEVIDLKKLGIFIEDNNDASQTLELMKQASREIIQSSGGDLRVILEIITAKDPMEVKNKVNKLMEDIEKRQAEQQQQAMELENKKLEAQNAAIERSYEHQRELKQMEINAKLLGDQLEATKYAAAEDINMNKEADSLEITEKELKFKEKELAEKVRLEELAIREKTKIEEMKIAKQNIKGNK